MKKVVYNKTKIIATAGPSSSSKSVLTQLVVEGVDVFRLNFSHGTYEDHQQIVNNIRAINDELDTHVALLLDLQGPKIRVGDIEQRMLLKKGELWSLTNRKIKSSYGSIRVLYDYLTKDVKEGDRMLLDDGKIELKVVAVGKREVKARVVTGGILLSRKGVNLPDSKTSIAALTPKDFDDINFGIKNEVDWIALSFVRYAKDVQQLKKILKHHNAKARIVAKIEKPEAVHHIDDILAVTDAVMIARGDLGVEVWMGEVPIIQKKIIERCNQFAKPVIVATQIMESMVENASPTRAEINDVANAVMDGTDALMLSAETAVGKYPIKVVRHMMRAINSVESQCDMYHKFQKISSSSPLYLHDSLILTACKLAKEVKAKAIVGMTVSGYTAYKSSSHRPAADIFMFTNNRSILNTMNMVWGTRTYFYDRQTTTDETISDISFFLKKKGFLRKGEIFVSLASMPIKERGRTNMMKVNVVN